MALFSFGKKKKPEEAKPAEGFAPSIQDNMAYPPVEQVITMQQQGMTNDQIVQALQRQGYETGSIMDALSQASAKGGVEPYAPLPEEQMGEPYAPAAKPFSRADVEGVVESVVEEKWNEFAKAHANINEWQEAMITRVDKIEQSVDDLRGDLDNLHKALVGKIGEYDKSLIDVGTEIKAMEKVFQKVLPTLTENVAELSRITKTAKQSPAPTARPSRTARK